jgi:hypothetical protein
MSRVFQGALPYSTGRFEVGDFAKHILYIYIYIERERERERERGAW